MMEEIGTHTLRCDMLAGGIVMAEASGPCALPEAQEGLESSA